MADEQPFSPENMRVIDQGPGITCTSENEALTTRQWGSIDILQLVASSDKS